jgi:hypothetical protein
VLLARVVVVVVVSIAVGVRSIDAVMWMYVDGFTHKRVGKGEEF